MDGKEDKQKQRPSAGGRGINGRAFQGRLRLSVDFVSIHAGFFDLLPAYQRVMAARAQASRGSCQSQGIIMLRKVHE